MYFLEIENLNLDTIERKQFHIIFQKKYLRLEIKFVKFEEIYQTDP